MSDKKPEVLEVFAVKDFGVDSCAKWGTGLSSTVWSAAMIIPTQDESGDFLWWVIYGGPVWLIMLGTALMQAFFAHKVRGIVESKACVTPSMLDFICVGVLTGSVLAGDIRDSARSFLWLLEMPYEEQLDITLEKTKYKDINGKPTVLWRPKGGIPDWYWGLCVILIILRVALAVSIVVIGAGHIIRSDNDEERIMNTIGLVFVVELDDIAHKLFTPANLQSALENMPPIEMLLDADPHEDDPPSIVFFLGVVVGVARFWVVFVSWILSTIILLWNWCEDSQAGPFIVVIVFFVCIAFPIGYAIMRSQDNKVAQEPNLSDV